MSLKAQSRYAVANAKAASRVLIDALSNDLATANLKVVVNARRHKRIQAELMAQHEVTQRVNGAILVSLSLSS